MYHRRALTKSLPSVEKVSSTSRDYFGKTRHEVSPRRNRVGTYLVIGIK